MRSFKGRWQQELLEHERFKRWQHLQNVGAKVRLKISLIGKRIVSGLRAFSSQDVNIKNSKLSEFTNG